MKTKFYSVIEQSTGYLCYYAVTTEGKVYFRRHYFNAWMNLYLPFSQVEACHDTIQPVTKREATGYGKHQFNP